MRGLFSKFGFLLNIGIVLLLFLSYLAVVVPPDSFWPLAFFGLAFPYLALINFVFLVIWVLQRSKRLILPLLVLVLGANHLNNTFKLIPAIGSRDGGIKVLSFNVHGFKSDLRSKSKSDPKIVEYLKSTGTGIVCLQEISVMKSGKLSMQAMRDELPGIKYYQMASPGNSTGMVTFSRFPIINMGEIRFPGSSNFVIFSDIKISNHLIVRVYNCHLQSYAIDPDDYEIATSSESKPDNQQMEKAKKISYKLKSGFILRAGQARMVDDHIRKSPYPVIVCGDFNDTPVSYTYRKVRGELKDAFVESGWGLSNTYNGKLPSFRIDYIFADNKFTITNYQRGKINYSDHFPIQCLVRFD